MKHGPSPRGSKVRSATGHHAGMASAVEAAQRGKDTPQKQSVEQVKKSPFGGRKGK